MPGRAATGRSPRHVPAPGGAAEASPLPMRLTRRAVIVAAAGWLAACATPGPREPERLSGRLAVQVAATNDTAARGFSGSFELRGDARRGSLDLGGPLGAAAVRAQWSEDRITWDDGRQRRTVDSLETLAREALGEELPLAALFDWLRARPWPGATALPRADGVPGFRQLGWSIDSGQAAEGLLVAERATAPRITLRIRLDNPPAP